jgi:hypothetical protein
MHNLLLRPQSVRDTTDPRDGTAAPRPGVAAARRPKDRPGGTHRQLLPQHQAHEPSHRMGLPVPGRTQAKPHVCRCPRHAGVATAQRAKTVTSSSFRFRHLTRRIACDQPSPPPMRCSTECDVGTKSAGDGTNRRAPGTKAPVIGTKSVHPGTRLERAFPGHRAWSEHRLGRSAGFQPASNHASLLADRRSAVARGAIGLKPPFGAITKAAHAPRAARS